VNRYARVVQILDDAIGGPDVNIGVHRAFWRGITREQFMAKKVFGLDVVTPGDGAASILVKALKGEAPFGIDLPDPTPGAEFSRMPAGLPPVAPDDIAFIEQWIDDGCPEGDTARTFTWRPTSAPDAGSRHDDIWFVSAESGWVVNSDGKILHTTDGGSQWEEQFTGGLYLRCIAFASPTRGWVGTLTTSRRLLETSDGGATWTDVSGLPADGPSRVCGLSVVNESVVYASGTNYPFPAWGDRPPAVMKTLDGGGTWTARDMTDHASLLVDVHFTTPERGWVVGGLADPAVDPGPGHKSDNVRAVVLFTEDGGETWVNRIAGLADELPLGEWGWKIHFLDDRVGFVALESITHGAILRTDDGGQTWARLPINDPQGNANLEGIGFIDANRGWVGGWGDPNFETGRSSATSDGGRTWADANEIGRFINRFRFLGDPLTVGYASGLSVYKYSDEPVPVAALAALPGPAFLDTREPMASSAPVPIRVTVPAGASHMSIGIWERFGDHVRQLLDERQPAAGSRTVEWDVTDDQGDPLDPGSFIVRVTVDGRPESRIVRVVA
jgi:photosystem II stability/assembly factor-like uncharacterized protein